MRHLQRLANEHFDVLVIGAGAFGVYAAWDAALRGLKVALIDEGDYCGGVSARCFRMIHGGIRYLQHLDVSRSRESARERAIFLRTAPHQVVPLPIAIPTYGLGLSSRWFLSAGTLCYDLLTIDRNRHIPNPSRRIPFGRRLSRTETLGKFPFLAGLRPTGAVEFCDGHMHNPARLGLIVAKSAAGRGAAMANYCAAEQLVVDDGRAVGVRARDLLTGNAFGIRAGCVINTAGPAAGRLLKRSGIASGDRRAAFSRDACLIIDRPAPSGAIAIKGQTRDLDALIDRGARHLFMVPWKGKTLIGVWHRVYRDPSADITVDSEEVLSWLQEFNASCPGIHLTLDNVLGVDYGLVPFGNSDPASRDLRFGHDSVFIDHASADGVSHALTLIGIRYTMGRADAVRAVDWAAKILGHGTGASVTESTPIDGGNIPDLGELLTRIRARASTVGMADRADQLLIEHGTGYEGVLSAVTADPGLAARCGDSPVTIAEVKHAVRHEGAVHLSDVIIRRTDLGALGRPTEATLRDCATVMARLLGWSPPDVQHEIQQVEDWFPGFVQRDSTREAGVLLRETV